MTSKVNGVEGGRKTARTEADAGSGAREDYDAGAWDAPADPLRGAPPSDGVESTVRVPACGNAHSVAAASSSLALLSHDYALRVLASSGC